MSRIADITARLINDSRGRPTVEAIVDLNDGVKAAASVPSGASTGSGEAKAVPVETAIKNIQGEIAKELKGKEITEQQEIDHSMVRLDGTDNKGRLGANAILAVSLAVARAAAIYKNEPLFRYINGLMSKKAEMKLPTPMFNLINGGEHAENNIDFQEFMVIPSGFNTFKQQLEVGEAIFHSLQTVLEAKDLKTYVGDEGGYAPDLDTNEMAFGLLVEAIKRAGYTPGENVFLGLDVAADYLPPTFQLNNERFLDMIQMFPIISLEDPLPEDDWKRWAELKSQIEQQNKTNQPVYLIGDDLFVTHLDRLKKGINEKVANAILVKVNQAGTLSETLEVIKTAQENNFVHIISHRSGETHDSFIADLAVGTGSKYIKAGAPNESHQERMVKYNRLVEIEHELNP